MQLTKMNKSSGTKGRKPRLGVPPETLAVNKLIKPHHKADSRCTHELALRKE